jgi:WD40 repeat protein
MLRCAQHDTSAWNFNKFNRKFTLLKIELRNERTMRYRLLFSFFCFAVAYTAHAQCDAKQYSHIFSEAQALQAQGQFIEAKNKYEAAKIYACGPKDLDKADKAVDALFEQINRLREQADSTALTAYANDLAYKSQIALERGDRTTAFRLAEFAHHYVYKNNPKVIQAIIESAYHNDKPDKSQWLPWCFSLSGHTEAIKCVDYSLDDKMLISASMDSTARIWSLLDKKTKFVLKGHSGSINSAAFSPRDDIAATGSSDETIKIWNIKDGKNLITLEGHTNEVLSIKFSPNGELLASASKDKSIKIWDMDTYKVIDTLDEFVEARSIDFSPDGKLLAAGYSDDFGRKNYIKVWDIKSRQTVLTINAHKDILRCVAFSPNGKMIATCAEDSTARIWELETGNQLFGVNHTNKIFGIAFSPDGTWFATASKDRSARIWNSTTGKGEGILNGHTDKIWTISCSKNGMQLATGSFDNTIRIWNLEKRNFATDLFGHRWSVNKIDYSPDGNFIASGSSDGTVKIWDVRNGKNILTSNQKHTVTDLSYSQDGKSLAIVTSSYEEVFANNKFGHSTAINKDTTAKILDLGEKRNISKISALVNNANSIVFSSDGQYLAISLPDSTIEIINWNTLETINKIDIANSGILRVAFAIDCKRIATWFRNSGISIWDVKNNSKEYYDKLGFWIHNAEFSPDGKHLAVAFGDPFGFSKYPIIWNTESWKHPYILEGHFNEVNCISFSPNGKWLATGSSDNSAKVWDMKSRKDIFTLFGHKSFINSVVFSPNGKKIATGSSDNLIKIWDIDPDTIILKIFNTYHPSGISKAQLKTYALEDLLDLQPDNESKFIDSGDIWQIAAFADLYVDRIQRTGFYKQTDYNHALRLYRACVDSGLDNAYFEKKLADLEAVWKDKTE